jgi:ribosomal protein L18
LHDDDDERDKLSWFVVSLRKMRLVVHFAHETLICKIVRNFLI